MSHPRYALRELEAEFVRRIDYVYREHVVELAEADGIMFLCPVCYAKNGGPVGTHRVMCWFDGKVPSKEQPGPGRWKPGDASTGIDNLTFVPHDYVDDDGQTKHRTQSVLLLGGCRWHGYVTDGHVHDADGGSSSPRDPQPIPDNPEYKR